ncbi:MAG: response regulator transcription factor [Acidimicrobiales bacterium]
MPDPDASPPVDPQPTDTDAQGPAPPIRVLVVDDHRMFSESLARLLGAEDDIEVVAVLDDAPPVLPAVRGMAPRVVLLDHHLPNGTGAELTAAIKSERPDTMVVILTGATDDRILLAAIDAGCSGFLTKDHAADEVVRAVRLAAAGEALIPPALLARLLPRLNRANHGLGSDLSPREREVLELMATGLSNKAIAGQLFLSVNTVRNHVQQILVKLDAHSKLEAVATAAREGIVSYPEG